MTRDRASSVGRDLHAIFTQWLEEGVAGDPPRDAAVHAAHCVGCRAATMAMDHLAVIDVGRAPMPPSRALAPEGTGVLARPRLVAAAASGFVVVAAAAGIGIGALAPGLISLGGARPSVEQEVLGGGLGVDGWALPDREAAPSFGGVMGQSNVATPEVTPDATSATPAQTPSSTQIPASQAPTENPLPSSPSPSNTQTIAPTSRPSHTAMATPSPTLVPTLEPTTPSPLPFGACDDGIDNDEDGFTDTADPGCVGDDNEFAA